VRKVRPEPNTSGRLGTRDQGKALWRRSEHSKSFKTKENFMKISGMALNVPKTNCNGSRLLALACALLVALAAAALHAQIITYTDVYDFSSSDGHQPFD
jgi:hypothetical protein